MEDQMKKLRQGALELGVELSRDQLHQFFKYYEMLVEKNKVMNLTAITEFDEVMEKHFLDSIALCRVVDLNTHKKVIDLGTGAGFPGIPLKIAFPKLEVSLVDSLNKRILFLQDVIRELELKNVSATHERAEIIANSPDFREKFDLCVSRAVANLSTLSEYCIPFVKVGGQFISYKSGECDEEVKAAGNAIAALGGGVREVSKFTLGESGRAFVIIDKVEQTKKKYPRKAGIPSKEPL